MRHIIPIVFVAATLLAGCRHRAPMVHTQTPARTVMAPLPTRSMLITVRGTNTSPDGAWRIVVSEVDSSIHLSRLTPSGSVTTSPQGWAAQEGWFAFIESESKVWAYDGDRALFLLTATPGLSGTYGPRSFPCAVPPQVFTRLSEPAQRAIEVPK
jgi:hypothetical protein